MNRFDDTPQIAQQDKGFRSDEVRGPYQEEWAKEPKPEPSDQTDSIGGGSGMGANKNPAWAGAQASLESDTAGRGMYGAGAEGASGYGEYDTQGGEMPSSPDASSAPAAHTTSRSAGASKSTTEAASDSPRDEAFGTRHWGHGEYKGDDGTEPRESKESLIERAVEKVGQFFGVGPKGYSRPDARVHEDVCEALQKHHEINAAEIEVEVSKGVVKLSGTVDDRGMRRLTEEAIAQVPGIREVENHLGVRNYVARTEDADRLKSGEETPNLHS